MLDPNPSTRATLDHIISHPWVTGLRKTPMLTLQSKKRRNAICYESPEDIHNILLEMNDCDCSCHKVGPHQSRHGMISKHCKDCEDVQANNPEIMLRRQIRLSRNSSLSSGYGSELGSQFLPSPRESQTNLLRIDLLPFLSHRSSLPRKSSASTIHAKTIMSAKKSHQRCSVPTILRESISNEEDDLVFVWTKKQNVSMQVSQHFQQNLM